MATSINKTTFLPTSTSNLQLRVDTTATAIATSGAPIYRVSFSMRLYAIYKTSIDFKNSELIFHDNKLTTYLNISLTAGQTSDVLHSGIVDIGWGTTTKDSYPHAPGAGMTSYYSTPQTAISTGVLTVPEGAINANLQATGHNSVDINVSYNSPYNFWKVKIYNTTGYLYKDNCVNGVNTISGLNPGTSYTFNVELWDIYNNECFKRVQLITKTTGGSYVDTVTAALIGGSVAFNLKTYSDSYKNVVTLKYGSTVLNTQTIYSTSLVKAISYTFNASQNDTFYKAIPNATTLDITVTVETYSGSTLIGTTNKTITLQVVKTAIVPTITSFKYRDTSTAVNKTGNNQYVVQSISKLIIDSIVTSARAYATIVNYRVDVSNVTYTNSSASITTGVITSNTSIVVTVTDSRGLTASLSIPFVKYLAYTKPIIKSFTMARVNDYEASTYLMMNGSWDRLLVDDVYKNLDIIMKYRYKESTSTTWGSYYSQTPTTVNGNLSYNKIVGSFDQTKSYDFELYIGDYFQAATLTTILTKGNPEVSIREGRVGINKVPNGAYSLDVNGAIRLEGDSYISAQLQGSSYLGAATKALIRAQQASGDSYFPIFTQDTQSNGKRFSFGLVNNYFILGFHDISSGTNSLPFRMLIDTINNTVDFTNLKLSANNIYDSGWKALPLASGWRSYPDTSFETPEYRYLNGVVYLKGLVQRYSGTSKTIATLPYKPAKIKSFPVITGEISGRVNVESTGSVIYISGKAEEWVSLEGLFFAL